MESPLGEARRRAEAASLISVLIPERGRPDSLDRLIVSLLETAGNDERIEILVAIDDDDPAWTDRAPAEHQRTRYLRWPRPITLGEKLNALSVEAKGGILWFVANDYVMETPGWPEKFRAAVARLPNGIGVPYPHDDLHPGHAAFPIITRRMMDSTGFFMAPWFPTWFIDTWWDQIGIMLDQHHEIDVTVRAPEGRGKTHGMMDLAFWVGFFRETQPLRKRDALNLAFVAHGKDTPAFREVEKALPMRDMLCTQRTAHLVDPAFIREWGARADSPPAPRYAEAKAGAEAFLADIRRHSPRRLRVAIACPSGRTWEATTATAVAAMAAHSSANGIELALINVQSSDVAHGRNASVELALSSNCDAIMWVDSDMLFPPNMLLRLLRHDKDIVGATYCKRVADADGTYPVLGKLVGQKPEVMTDGLHEALLMPGGLMLVRTDVYRRLGWPWFMQCYRWQGANRLEAFKNLMRNYFATQPPEEALAELDGTALGGWIEDHYEVGEFEESSPMFSEDLFFVRRARRAGFTVYADIKLTGECAHIGEAKITCLLGSEIKKMPMAAE